MSYPELPGPNGKAPDHQRNALKGKDNNISNAEVRPHLIHLDPGNYDRDTLKNIWNPILERRGWEITDITDDDYNEIVITLESQGASDSMSKEDLYFNAALVTELEDTEAFRDFYVNINDTTYISLVCALHPEH